MPSKASSPQNSQHGQKAQPKLWSWPGWVPWVCCAWCIVVAAFNYAKPVDDADLWWQMAYGKYMLENGTLIPDHTIYSWTPAQGGYIYCAWVGEIFLYLAYTLGSLPLLFTIRYLAVAAFLIVCLLFARQLSVHRHPLTWLVILLGLLMSRAGTFLKPEMLSYVFAVFSVGIWLRVKARPQNVKLCYALPAIMLIWVNSHGAVIFGVMLYFLIGAGEVVSAVLGLQSALPARTLRHLLTALVLSSIAALVTPYGIDYPAQLYERFTEWDNTKRLLGAYQSVFSYSGRALHFDQFLFIGGFVFGALYLMSRPFDLPVLIVSICFGFLYTKFLRTTYFFAPVLSMSTIYLLAHAPRASSPQTRRLRGLSPRVGNLLLYVSLALMLYVGGRAGFERLSTPSEESWVGFGYSYCDATIEAEFIRRFVPPQRIGNTYSLGGYLLWSLAPDYKVMIDPRYFPYEQWIQEYLQFEEGKQFRSYLDKYACNVFVVAYRLGKLLDSFINAPDWHVGFFGPTAVVLFRSDVVLPVESSGFAQDRFKQLKSPNAAFDLLSFAMKIGDYDSAGKILATMRKDVRFVFFRREVTEYHRYYDSMTAFKKGEFDKAIQGLEACRKGGVIWNNAVLVSLRNQQTSRLMQEGREEAALEQARLALAVDAADSHALWNAGVIGWWLEKQKAEKPQSRRSEGSQLRRETPFSWKATLRRFLSLHGNDESVPAPVIETAKRILAGTYEGKLIILAPKVYDEKKTVPLHRSPPAAQKEDE